MGRQAYRNNKTKGIRVQVQHYIWVLFSKHPASKVVMQFRLVDFFADWLMFQRNSSNCKDYPEAWN
jgi:hypothetical protein